jgi:myb proto-oncogene protein
LDSSIDRMNGRTGEWSDDEDIKLKDAVQTHGDKNWAALISGRTQKLCARKWHHGLDANIDRANGRAGIWTEDEDIKLRGAVQMHGGKNWGAIASLVPGRTRSQCNQRWHDALDPSSTERQSIRADRQQSKTASNIFFTEI